ncbi:MULTISPECIES: helix-turn-helix domain-containing protein [Bacillus cereus group]|uniref:helix-turn-helix domain-containing protein n=1 Tax=Bacillus cereus group TaxID=86661 RepID=UPI000BEE3EF6|nr:MULTISPECIES: helix-turn-helix transcriptional regulator [Bacillus cereus group]PEG03936.1 transcriptional regulator [Bacillus cereus]PGS60083.1 transcriptional regulator [Bacillus cereus]PGW53444.1 transcriptional regulator [Bacillus thuringiensis]
MKTSTLGEKIKELRKSNKFTQKQLAEKLGKAESTIRMWELGTNTPNAKTIAELSKVLNVGYTELMIKAGYINKEQIKDEEASYLMNINELNTIEKRLEECNSEEEKKNLNMRKTLIERRIAELRFNLIETEALFYYMTPEEEEAYIEGQNKSYLVEEYRRREYPDIKDFLEQGNVYFNGKSLTKEHRELATRVLGALFEKLEVTYPSDEKIEKEYDDFTKAWDFAKKEWSKRSKED